METRETKQWLVKCQQLQRDFYPHVCIGFLFNGEMAIHASHEADDHMESFHFGSNPEEVYNRLLNFLNA